MDECMHGWMDESVVPWTDYSSRMNEEKVGRQNLCFWSYRHSNVDQLLCECMQYGWMDESTLGWFDESLVPWTDYSSKMNEQKIGKQNLCF